MAKKAYVLTNRGQAWVRLTHELEQTEVQLQALQAIPSDQLTPMQKAMLEVAPLRIEKLKQAVSEIEGSDD